jgi:hypothetical protein
LKKYEKCLKQNNCMDEQEFYKQCVMNKKKWFINNFIFINIEINQIIWLKKWVHKLFQIFLKEKIE